MGQNSRRFFLNRLGIFLVLIFLFPACISQEPSEENHKEILPVAYGNEVLIQKFLPELKNKRIALVINHTALVKDSVFLVDTLLKLGTDIRILFSPEHGFKGNADAGEILEGKYSYKNIPVFSLYGKNKKPTASSLENIDLILFDIQDVGARFYTYISTLALVMEAAAEEDIPVWVLDRPNPNLFLTDGTVLDTSQYKSFVGMFPIPVAYGLTFGELAQMINAEGWINKPCSLKVIPMKNYRRKFLWKDLNRKWIPPSPNLKNDTAAMLYPILCFFEGTSVSVGRGTKNPFQIVGAPYHLQFRKYFFQNIAMEKYGFRLLPVRFVPVSLPGAKTPKYKQDTCYGIKIIPTEKAFREPENFFLLSYSLLKNFYNEWREYQKITRKKLPPFFNNYFEKLVGTDSLRSYILQGLSEREIYQRFLPRVEKFKQKQRKYFLYKE